MLTHRNMVAICSNATPWLAPFLRQELAGGQEIVITALPLYHIFAMTASLVFFKSGAQNVLGGGPAQYPRPGCRKCASIRSRPSPA